MMVFQLTKAANKTTYSENQRYFFLLRMSVSLLVKKEKKTKLLQFSAITNAMENQQILRHKTKIFTICNVQYLQVTVAFVSQYNAIQKPLHSLPYCGQLNHTSRTTDHSMCNAASTAYQCIDSTLCVYMHSHTVHINTATITFSIHK